MKTFLLNFTRRHSCLFLITALIGLSHTLNATVLDDFNDNTKTGWTDFTFIPGFGIPVESNGQLRFEQSVSPSGGGIFSASQRTSEAYELKDGRTIEFRVDVVQGGAKDSFAILAFVPTAGTGGPGSLAGYGLAKSTTDVLITKGISKYFIADAGAAANLKQDNITLVLRLTAQGGSVTINAQVLDKEKADAVIWERTVVDTPVADVMTDGSDSPAGPFLTSGYFTLYLYQDLDKGAVEDPYLAVYDNAEVLVTDQSALDDFNDNTKTGWTDFTFIPGFGIPTESNGQFRFEQAISPSGAGIFSASQKTSRPFELKNGEEIEFRADVVQGGAKDSFAILAFVPASGTGGPGSLAGYGLAKSTTDVLITKGINKYFIADAGEAAHLKQDNITLVLRLRARNGSVTIRAQVLDKDQSNAVIWERVVVDTPSADVMTNGTDSPAAPFITSGYFTLYLYQDLDKGAVEDPYRVVYDNTIVASVPAPENLPPVISDLRPGDTANFLPSSTKLEFKVSDDKAVADEKIAVILNGTRVTSANGLTLTGAGNSRQATLSPLAANIDYTATIEVTDSDGVAAAKTIYFDTFGSQTTTTIEVEDYNFNGGQFINAPSAQTEGTGPDATGYANQAGVQDVDFNDTRMTPRSQDAPWRSFDAVRMARSVDGERPRFAAAGGAAAGVFDYVVGDIAAGEWLNYTRQFAPATYEIYLRQSIVNMPSGESVLELVTSAPTQPDQSTRVLGSFLGTRTGFVFHNFPLTDGTGTKKTTVRLNGETTLRLRQITPDDSNSGSARYQNYLIFVPVADAGVQRATVTSSAPAANSTAETATPVVQVTIQNRDTSVNVSSIALKLNGSLVTGASIKPSADGATVAYPISPLPASGALNTASVSFKDSENQEITSEWQFTVSYNSLDATTRVVGTGKTRGFNLHVVQAPQDLGALENSLERAETQLAIGSNIARAVDLKTTADVINFNKRAGESAGYIGNDAPVPGIDPDVTGNGDADFAMEISTYLELPSGVHRFGVATDDGYKLASGKAPLNASTPVLAFHNGGPARETFEFVVTEAGLYPFRMVWYERGGAAFADWISVDLANPDNRTLINDASAPGAIKAWREVNISAPSVAVQSADAITGPFAADTSAVIDTSARSVTLPLTPGNRFYRLHAGSALKIKTSKIQGASLVLTWE